MINDTTTASPAATLNEQELFAVFLNMPIVTRTTLGSSRSSEEVLSYTPEFYLLEGGAYSELEDATAGLLDYLLEASETEDALDALICGVEAYAKQLKQVLKDFILLKAAQAATPPDEEPSDPIELKVWEKAWEEYNGNPRFLPPSATVNE